MVAVPGLPSREPAAGRGRACASTRDTVLTESGNIRITIGTQYVAISQRIVPASAGVHRVRTSCTDPLTLISLPPSILPLIFTLSTFSSPPFQPPLHLLLTLSLRPFGHFFLETFSFHLSLLCCLSLPRDPRSLSAALPSRPFTSTLQGVNPPKGCLVKRDIPLQPTVFRIRLFTVMLSTLLS